MVVIRLARTGAKKKPFYHVVVADQRSPRDSKFIEQVGYFNPVAKGAAIRLKLDKESIEQWVGKGAQPSERVQQLLKEFGADPIKAAAARKLTPPKAKAAPKPEAAIEVVAETAPAAEEISAVEEAPAKAHPESDNTAA